MLWPDADGEAARRILWQLSLSIKLIILIKKLISLSLDWTYGEIKKAGYIVCVKYMYERAP